MSVCVRRLIHPSEEDIDAYCHVLADAFDYKFFASALMNDPSLQVPIHRAHVAAALTGEGEVHIAETPDSGVVGVSVWFGPNQKFLSTELQRNSGWNQLMSKLDDRCRNFWPRFLDDYDELVEGILGPGVKLGAWHLQLIGVKRSAQGRGVGSALIKFGEDKARADKVASCLETTTGGVNEAYYKSIGYTLQGQGPIPWVDGSNVNFGVFIKHTEED